MEKKIPEGTRVYRPRLFIRCHYVFLGFVTLLFGVGVWLGFFLALLQHSLSFPRVLAYLGFAGGFCITVAGVGGVRSYWDRVLILTPDSVSVWRNYRTKTLKFGDILGWQRERSWNPKYPRTWILVFSKTTWRRDLIIDQDFVVDEFFRQWLATFPDAKAPRKIRYARGAEH